MYSTHRKTKRLTLLHTLYLVEMPVGENSISIYLGLVELGGGGGAGGTTLRSEDDAAEVEDDELVDDDDEEEEEEPELDSFFRGRRIS